MAKRGRAMGARVARRVAEARDHAHRHRPWKIPLAAAVAIVAVLVGAAAAILLIQPVPQAPLPVVEQATAESSQTFASDGQQPRALAAEAVEAVPATGSVEVEVPDVVGKHLSTAEMVLDVAGFKTVTRVAEVAQDGLPPNTIIDQTPDEGTRLMHGDCITVTYNPAGAPPVESRPVVVIDPGHQARPDLMPEAVGPGSTETKEKVRAGATGVATHIPEYQEALAISLKLRDRLEAAGIETIMIRTTDNVNISNSQRAIIGNDAQADLVVRVHLDSSSDSSVRGISTLYPAGNSWCRPIEASSRRAAAMVEAQVVHATGAARRGLFPRGDIASFNWSTRPTIIVECAFLSNPLDDRLVATAAYQDRLAAGISAGVLEYLAVQSR